MSEKRDLRHTYSMRLPYSNFNGLRIIGRDTATIAVVERWAADQGHTDFIVKACNSHGALVDELTSADAIIKAMLNAMTAKQKIKVSVKLESDGVSDDGMVRAHERRAALAAAGVTP